MLNTDILFIIDGGVNSLGIGTEIRLQVFTIWVTDFDIEF